MIIASISGEAIGLPDWDEDFVDYAENMRFVILREESRKILLDHVFDNIPTGHGQSFWSSIKKDANGVIATSRPTAMDPETHRAYHDCFQFMVEDCFLIGPKGSPSAQDRYRHFHDDDALSYGVEYRISDTSVQALVSMSHHMTPVAYPVKVNGYISYFIYEYDLKTKQVYYSDYHGYVNLPGKNESLSWAFIDYLFKNMATLTYDNMVEPWKSIIAFTIDGRPNCSFQYHKYSWRFSDSSSYFPHLPGPSKVDGWDPIYVEYMVKNFNTDVMNAWGTFHLNSDEDRQLDRKCVESFQIKDAKVLRECIDTGSMFSGAKAASDIVKGFLPDLSGKRLAKMLDYTDIYRLRKSLAELSKNIASTKLWWDYGIKLPLQTLKKWIGPGGTYWRILDDGVQNVIRSGINRATSVTAWTSVSSEVHRMYRIGPRGNAEMFYDQCYRHGLMTNLDDAWDLIPLSFAFDWITGIVNNTVSKITDSIDSWRFNYSYCCTSEKLTYRMDIGYSQLIIHGYVRRYDGRHPNCDYHFDINDMGGKFSLSSSADASALLVALWKT